MNKLLGVIAVLALIATPLKAMGQTANATAGFIANPANTTKPDIGTADPNYNTYQNLALGFSIKYLKNMTINQRLVNSTANTPDHIVRFQIPLNSPYNEHMTVDISVHYLDLRKDIGLQSRSRTGL